MARYFFHFHDGTDQPDHTGTELASAQAARDAAVIFMGERLKDLDGGFWPDAEWSIRVVDALRSAPFGSVAIHTSTRALEADLRAFIEGTAKSQALPVD